MGVLYYFLIGTILTTISIYVLSRYRHRLGLHDDGSYVSGIIIAGVILLLLWPLGLVAVLISGPLTWAHFLGRKHRK